MGRVSLPRAFLPSRARMGFQHWPEDKRVAASRKGGAAGGHRWTSAEAKEARKKSAGRGKKPAPKKAAKRCPTK
jgi:hypothetical protein